MSSFTDSFQPYDLGPDALLDLHSEIRDKGSEILSLYFDSVAGYEHLSRHLARWKAGRTKALKMQGIKIDRKTWTDLEEFSVSPPPRGHGPNFAEFSQTLADYRQRLRPAGRNSLLIGNYLLIALYQHWEDSWRVKIADSLNLPDKNQVKSDFWGDLRLFRICLIHKRGIADKDVATKCVLFKWFNEGDPIVIDRPKIDAIVAGFFTFLYSELIAYGRNGGPKK